MEDPARESDDTRLHRGDGAEGRRVESVDRLHETGRIRRQLVQLGTTQEKKERKGKFFQVSAMAGFGLGTGQQVDPPLDNSEITDKGFMLGGKAALGTHLSKYFDFGLMVPVQYGYFFKNGVAVNDVTNHYQGIHLEALLFLRMYIKLI